jgi:hypothetical protein
MLFSCVRKVRVSLRKTAPALLGFITLAALPLQAQTSLPPVTVGAGMQTSFVHTDPDGPDNYTDRFLLNSARIYLGGSVTEKIKFMFNTEYEGATNKIGVLDAAARLEFNPKFNIWMGRLLPPSDRANLYGPYYAHHWNTFSDGIQNGHPSVLNGGSPTGRDNGVVWWGDFEKLKLSAGAFDGPSLTGKNDLLVAGRAQIDFWDKEEGYYLNGTYYGDKDLLGLGFATQIQDGDSANTIDFLLEKKLGGGGVVTLESEASYYSNLGGYDGNYTRSSGAYVLGSYLFPKKVGPGQFELLGKYGEAKFFRGKTVSATPYVWKTTEVNFNYVIKQFNARVMFFFKDNNYTAIKTDNWQGGVGLQIQM